MNKKLVLMMSVVVLVVAGCEVEHDIGDGCIVGKYECSIDSDAVLLKCDYIDNTKESRWYRLGKHETKELCLNLSCSECKEIQNHECPDNKYFNGSECIDDDTNNNRLKDYYETAANQGKDCHYYSDCDSAPSNGDGFCDSFIGYKCSTKCTSDKQCVPYTVIDDEQYKNVCRPDGRCAPDTFIAVLNITSDKKVTLYSNHCDAHIDWGDGSQKDVNDCTGDSPSHEYKEGRYELKITGIMELQSTSPYKSLDTLEEVKSFGSIGIGANLFAGTTGLKLSAVDIPDASLMTDMNHLFYASDFNQNIEHWDVSNVTNMNSLFHKSIFNKPINAWDTHSVTDMSDVFRDATDFNQPLSYWDVERVKYMNGMFNGAKIFNQDISNWKTVRVTNMNYMFKDATSFNQDISAWNTSNVTNMHEMFSKATSFNQDIGDWNTSNVTDMNGMFLEATSFNQNIGEWDTSNVTDMAFMFDLATSFNQNIGKWNTSNVTDMSYMFYKAKAFNQGIGDWNTSNVTDMNSMFCEATVFNQDIGKWNVSSVVNFSSMFYNADHFSQDSIKNWIFSDYIKSLKDNSTPISNMFTNSGLAEENKVCDIVNHWITNNMIPAAFIDTFGVECSNSSPNE